MQRQKPVRLLVLTCFVVAAVMATDEQPEGSGTDDAPHTIHKKSTDGTIEVSGHFTEEETNTPHQKQADKVRRLTEQLENLQQELDAAKARRLSSDVEKTDVKNKKTAQKKKKTAAEQEKQKKPWHVEDKSFKPKNKQQEVHADGSSSENLQPEIDNLKHEVNALGARITNLKRYTADMVRMVYEESGRLNESDKNAQDHESTSTDLEDLLEKMCPSEERRASLARDCATHDAVISERVYDAESWDRIDDEHICFTADNHDRFWSCVCSKCPIPFRLSPEHYDNWKHEYERRECHKLNKGKSFPKIGDNACDFLGKKYPNVRPDPPKTQQQQRQTEKPKAKSAAPQVVFGKTPLIIGGFTLAAAMIGGLFLVVKS